MNVDHDYVLQPGAAFCEETGQQRAAVQITIGGATVVLWTDSVRTLARDLQTAANTADTNTRKRTKGKAS